MKNSGESKLGQSQRRYLSGMMIGFMAGIAIGIAMDNIAIGVAIGSGMGVSLGIAFQQQGEEAEELRFHPSPTRVVALILGLVILLGLSAVLFLLLL